MGRRKQPPLEPMSEETVRTVARIIGPSGAAQMALDNAAERRARGEHVEFFKSGEYIVVRGTREQSE